MSKKLKNDQNKVLKNKKHQKKSPIAPKSIKKMLKAVFYQLQKGYSKVSTTLDGGTYVVTAYPGVPVDVAPLLNITGENLCSEPVVVPITGCGPYLDIVANPANPSFPVNSGESGTATYNVTFKPNPAGPACCAEATNTIVIGGAINDGDLEVLGSEGNSPWTSASTNFGSVMCSSSLCGGGEGISYGVPPNSGHNLAWFGRGLYYSLLSKWSNYL